MLNQFISQKVEISNIYNYFKYYLLSKFQMENIKFI